ncbi:MAG TPA: biopolymer transporter ExbD [Polyangium sp.]|jgi:biopolymer transport protein ExbD/biopolymer transport protein TolR|nr:biopolymer transporter ExbD [Polyangium sp.]
MGMQVGADKKNDSVMPVMNVTPLVDVVLVLLIIFMVVAPLLDKQIWLRLPMKDNTQKNEPPPLDADKPVVLTVDAQGTIRVNQNVIDKAELRERLRKIFAARAEQVLYFDAADDAPYGVTVQVMDIAKQGGAKGIAILTEKVAGN